jgi:hypothetical protein
MSHKLQVSPSENNGCDSVVRNHNSTSQAEIASNDAGPACATATEFARDAVPEQDSLSIVSTAEEDVACTSSSEEPFRGQPEPRKASSLRCEVARSDDYDPTGERAVACGAQAQVLCEYCGPMCSSCTEEAFCFYGEHRFVDPDEQHRAQSGNSEALSEPSQQLFEVVYLELVCPHCDTVRLALPRPYTPDADWKLVCPICSAPTTWRYLAHGVTQRELPFYERFDRDSAGKGRIPWDQLARLFDEDEE